MADESRLRLVTRKRKCVVCGCTDMNACMTEEGPCYWIAPYLCSNPSCLRAVTVSIADKSVDIFH